MPLHLTYYRIFMQEQKWRELNYEITNYIPLKPDFLRISLPNDGFLRNHYGLTGNPNNYLNKYKLNGESFIIQGVSDGRQDGWEIQLNSRQMWRVVDLIQAKQWYKENEFGQM